MFRSSTLMISALVLTATASAQTERAFELKFQYDAAELVTAAGAESIMSAIETEAEVACTSERTIGGRTITRTDRVCIKDITAKLVTAIDAPTLEVAYADSEYFVSPRRRRLLIASR